MIHALVSSCLRFIQNELANTDEFDIGMCVRKYMYLHFMLLLLKGNACLLLLLLLLYVHHRRYSKSVCVDNAKLNNIGV